MAKPTRRGNYAGEIFKYPNGESWEWKEVRNQYGDVVKSGWNQLTGPSSNKTLSDDGLPPNPGFGDLVNNEDLYYITDGNGNVIDVKSFGPGANDINTTPLDELMEPNDGQMADFNDDGGWSEPGGDTGDVIDEEYFEDFINFTVSVNNNVPGGGDVYVNGQVDNNASRVYSSKEIHSPQGKTFEVRSGEKRSIRKYRLFTRLETKVVAGSVLTEWIVVKETYENNVLLPIVETFQKNQVVNLGFKAWQTYIPEGPTPSNYIVEVELDGDAPGGIRYVFGKTNGVLRDGDTLLTVDNGQLHLDPQFQPGDTSKYFFQYILYKNGNLIDESSSHRQSYELDPDVPYLLVVTVTKGTNPPTIETPVITVSNTAYSFDLSAGKLPISYRTANADGVELTLGKIKRKLPAQGELVLYPKDFSGVGLFDAYLQPVNNLGGKGKPAKVVINVSNTITIKGPDITHIVYPQNILGADFKGYNVDFKISWSSVNTNWVDIYAGKVDNSTKLYEKRPPNGQLTLNVGNVLLKAGLNLDDSRDKTDFKLLFIPYNSEGNTLESGKTEEITISFDKGDLNLRRGSVVRDIREAITRQFDKSTLNAENSKYLTHLLHLGDGNNKLISTWGIDTDTFSEFTTDPATGRETKTKEVKTLVLKLYEPLPKEIEPNQQVWLSKIQSIPLIEQMTVIDETVEECRVLQPNFNVDITDEIGYQLLDDLVASGSTTSTDLVNNFISSSEFSLDNLDIQFVTASKIINESHDGLYPGTTIEKTGNEDYWWSNFVKYSSAEERVNNFYYKIKLLEFYNSKYNTLTSGSAYTGSVSVMNEANKIQTQINNVKQGFDSFEKWLFTSSSQGGLTYPKQNYTGSFLNPTGSDGIAWYNGAIASAQDYDYYNTSNLVNNLPQHIQDDDKGQEFTLFFNMIGQHFDILWTHNKAFAKSRKLEHKYETGIKDDLLYHLLESLGWDADLGAKSQALWEYAFGKSSDGSVERVMSGKDRQHEVWRRILNNLPYLLKHKGTKRALNALLSCYGIPASMLTIMEFGGPREITDSGTTKFTYEDRTAAINFASSSNAITVDWKEYSGSNDYPNSVQVRVHTDQKQDQRIISASGWSLDLLKETGSLAKVQLTVGSVSSSTSTFPFYNDEYTYITVNRNTGSAGSSSFEVFAKEGFQERIRNEASTSLSGSDTDWENGSSIQVGGVHPYFTGSVDEFRLWISPLGEGVIDNHALVPDAINGNHNSASSEDLIFRNDFEYPKDRNADTDIKNVSIIRTYVTSSVASGFTSAATYPYQYTPYDRTVTAQVPQSGFNYSNKFRFETQYELNTTTQLNASSSIDLSHRQRSTKRSFDQSPIDSDRLGLFFSPIKEINMDILRSVGPINVDDFIGDPSDDYNYTYQQLDNFREYYFQRYNLNFNEYVQLVRYIEKGLFDQLESLVPARAKVAKGLLFEPHILERSKTQWKRPSANQNNFTASIDTNEDVIVTSNELTHLAIVSASDDIVLTSEQPFYEGRVTSSDETDVTSEYVSHTGTYLSENEFTQSGVITRNSGSTMGGFEIDIDAKITGSFSEAYLWQSAYEQIGGFGPNDLSVAGFGLWGSGSHSIRTRLIDGQYVKDRVKVFKVVESYTDTERVQIGGYPTGSGPVVYDVREVTKYKTVVNILPFTGSIGPDSGSESQLRFTASANYVSHEPLDGYFTTHYKFVEDLPTGLENSYFNGAKQTLATTLDGGEPVVTFITNPNTLRVSDTGRGSGEPILEVD